MAKRFAVDLYYDVMSPYSWIAFEGLLRYQQVWPINVSLKPFQLRDIIINTGNRPPLAVPNKGKHMYLDIERNNDFWGLDLKPAKDFPKWVKNKETTTEGAQRLLVAIQMEKPELLETVSREYWKRLWNQGQPIFQQNDHEIVLKASGIQNIDHFLKMMSEPEVVKQLKKNTDMALEQGCFGAPWIVVHKDGKEHGFFGSDRFSLIGHLIGETFTHGYKELAKI